MFIIKKSETYRYPVTFSTPSENGQEQEENSFTAIFKRLSEDELQGYAQQALKGKINDRKFVQEVLVGWEGIHEYAGGPEVPFTPAMRDKLLNIVGFGKAVSRALFASVEDAPRKNV